MNKKFFTGKNILVMGLGRFGGGVDVVKFACGAGAKIAVTDLASQSELAESINQLKAYSDIEYHLGGHKKEDFEQADIIITNPAVPNDNEFLEAARKAGKIVTSQINIFFEMCPAVIIGITGAIGKSTTAALTAHILKNAGRQNVWLSGNIGNEPLLTILDEINSDDLVVLELSSFQIEQLAQIKKAPKVALLTNLTPNHLDRYGTFANYCAAKENIFKFQELDEKNPAVSIFNAADEIGSEWFEKYEKDKGRVCIRFSEDDISKDVRKVFTLPGRANLFNLASAIAVAKYFGVQEQDIIKTLGEFKGLADRLELVAEHKGIKLYNDSKATTPASTIAALEAFEEPVIIIAGGYDKNLSFEQLGKTIALRTKAAILMGQTAKKISDAIERKLATETTEHTEKSVKIEIVDSLAEAVSLAGRLAVKGDVVLLSPACASYDMFDNYRQRGQEFIRLVQEIIVD